MNALTKSESGALAMSEDDLLLVLRSSIFPGAAIESIKLAIGYCKAANLDVMLKPVHIVPMWDGKSGSMRDVILPGIGLYRIQAARTGQYAGQSEAEYGPLITQTIGGVEITFPEWCKVTVRRLVGGIVAEFTAVEYWLENYAVKGGKEKSIAPNAMWSRRTRGQLAKCAEAQALRKGFPEVGSLPTAEEMEGRAFDYDLDATTGEVRPATQMMPQRKSAQASHESPPADRPPAPPAPPTASAGGVINPGQVKYLENKIASLDIGAEAVGAMLARHGIAKLDTTITVERFDALRAELAQLS